MVEQCHNLVSLDAYIQIPWVRLEGLEPTFKTVLLPHLEILKLREEGSTSAVISTINTFFVNSLQYICPRRYENNGDQLEPQSQNHLSGSSPMQPHPSRRYPSTHVHSYLNKFCSACG